MKDFEKMKPKPEETGGKHGERISKKKRSKTPYILAVVVITVTLLILILNK